MVITNIEGLRDPFVLVTDDAYYVYGTGVSGRDWDDTVWACYKNTSGSLDGEWVNTKSLVYEHPLHSEKNFWAPEVYKYKGSFYMFATYFSTLTQHRGCSILKSASPDGSFVEITNGHITPKDQDSIDGTFYIDRSGQPWMIYVHEWTSTVDNVGRMSAAKLSEDLSHFISEPVELFRADSPSWSKDRVTDGCFMYSTSNNELLMLWSNFSDSGYCVGIARSENGDVVGRWIQNDELLFSKNTTGDHDGGHGMIFRDRNGCMYLSVHSPNKATSACSERVVFVPVYEMNGTLVCK